MIADNLNNKQFTAKDIKNILGIDRNKLFYWIKTYRMVKPEIEEASGTGKTSKYSLKNLFELSIIKELLSSGFDIKTTTEIKNSLDDYKDSNGLNIYELLRENIESKYFGITVAFYPTKGGYLIELEKFEIEADPFDGYTPQETEISQDEIESKSNKSVYTKIEFEISELFRDLVERIKKY